MSVVKQRREEPKGFFFFLVNSSSFLGDDHLGDEVDDGAGGLVGVHLSEEVADVVGCASLLTSHKPKQPEETESDI